MKIVFIYLFIILSLLSRFDLLIYKHLCSNNTLGKNHIIYCEKKEKSCCETPLQIDNKSNQEKISCCSTEIEVVSQAQTYEYKNIKFKFFQLFAVPTYCSIIYTIFYAQENEECYAIHYVYQKVVEDIVTQNSQFIFYG